jgi:hypothetical protein
VKGGIRFIEPLPSNGKKDAPTDAQTAGGTYEVAAETGADAMMCIPSFIKTGSVIKN